MRDYRFFVPVLPLIFLLQQEGIHEVYTRVESILGNDIVRRISKFCVYGFIASGVVFFGYWDTLGAEGQNSFVRQLLAQRRAEGVGFFGWPREYSPNPPTDEELLPATACYINRRAADLHLLHPRVAMQMVGRTPFYARNWYIVDTAGLVSIDVALMLHRGRSVPDIARRVLEYQPDFLWLIAEESPQGPKFLYPVEAAIAQLPEFRDNWRLRVRMKETLIFEPIRRLAYPSMAR